MKTRFCDMARSVRIRVCGAAAWDDGELAGAPSMAARAARAAREAEAHGGLHHIGGAMQEASAGARP